MRPRWRQAPDQRASPAQRLRPRLAAARGALAVAVTAHVAATALALGQWTLLATVLAGAAQRRWDVVPLDALAWLACLLAGRAGAEVVAAGSGRLAATAVTSQLRLAVVRHRLEQHRLEQHRVVQQGHEHHRTTRHRRAGEHDGDGPVAVQAVEGIDGLDVYVAEYLPQRVLAVVTPVLVLALVAVLDPPSALVLAVTLPVVPVFMVVIGRSAAARSRANLAALDALAGHFLDVVRGLGTLRLFNQAAAQADEVGAVTDRYRRTTAETLRLAFLSGAVLDLAAALATALVAVSLGVRLVAGSVELLPAMTVLLVVPELFAPLRRLGSLFHASSDGLATAARILDLLDGDRDTDPNDPSDDDREAQPAELPTPRSHPAAHRFDPGSSPIRLNSVTVRFSGRRQPALDGVDLCIRPGQLVVVVGSSGAGKTTLGRVLVGLTRPDSGAVQVGDQILADADLDSWRHRVAWAPQRPTLLTCTVGQNLALGLAGVGEADVVAAARRSGAHEFVATLPDGYDTVVGPGSGVGLSAGQRQRLGLARALLRDSPLLVLDEPTAYLDDSAASQVRSAVDGLRGRCAVVLITHDEALLPQPDQVLRLAAGRVVATTGSAANGNAAGDSAASGRLATAP